MSNDESQSALEAAWEMREEMLYPALFGSTGPGIYTLDAKLFAEVFHQTEIDLRWLHYGVFECPPGLGRKSWLYVSSGLSNPWDEQKSSLEEPSGLGCEFIFECPMQSKWAISFLQRMTAFQLLLAAGRFPNPRLLDIGDRVPLRGPIDGASSLLTWAILALPTEVDARQQLPSGYFDFIEFIGVSEEEAAYARANGTVVLAELLAEHGAAPVTVASRKSVL